jgi:pyruvate,water dikinase
MPPVVGKNAALGEMLPELSGKGLRVPNGFAVIAAANLATLDPAGPGNACTRCSTGLSTPAATPYA